MKNYHEIIILAFLIIGIILISGCTSTGPTSAAVTTPTPQIVYVTVLVTPTPIQTIATTVPTTVQHSQSTHFSGNGDDVQTFTATGSGLRIFTMQYSGAHNFAVILKDSNGEWIDLLANEIGSYSGRKSAVLRTGTYYLDVTASGPWSIDILS